MHRKVFPAIPNQKLSSSDFLVRNWRYSLDASIRSPSSAPRPSPDGDQVILTGPEGDVAAVDMSSGETRWITELEMEFAAGAGTGDGIVVVGSSTGEVIALDRTNGQEVWRKSIVGEVLSAPVIAPGIVVVRAGDTRFLGLDTANGDLVWTVKKNVEGLSVHGVSTPLLNGRRRSSRVLPTVGFWRVDIDRGRVLWETPIGSRRGNSEVKRLADIDGDPALFGTILYVASYQSRVVAMALGSPRVIWSSELSTLKNFGVDADHLVCNYGYRQARRFGIALPAKGFGNRTNSPVGA